MASEFHFALKENKDPCRNGWFQVGYTDVHDSLSDQKARELSNTVGLNKSNGLRNQLEEDPAELEHFVYQKNSNCNGLKHIYYTWSHKFIMTQTYLSHWPFSEGARK